MTTTITNIETKLTISCEPQRSEILDMIDKGKDSQVIGGNLVEIIKSYRKDKTHEVEVFVHNQ